MAAVNLNVITLSALQKLSHCKEAKKSFIRSFCVFAQVRRRKVAVVYSSESQEGKEGLLSPGEGRGRRH